MNISKNLLYYFITTVICGPSHFRVICECWLTCRHVWWTNLIWNNTSVNNSVDPIVGILYERENLSTKTIGIEIHHVRDLLLETHKFNNLSIFFNHWGLRDIVIRCSFRPIDGREKQRLRSLTDLFGRPRDLSAFSIS